MLVWFNQVRDLFEEAGWVFKPSKSSGFPSQYVVFLGLGIDSRDMTFNIPDLKMTRVVHWAEELLHLDRVSVKSLAGFVGLLQSLSRATGPIVSVMTRSLYREIAKARSWSSFCK